jgi:hypothetical protein
MATVYFCENHKGLIPPNMEVYASQVGTCTFCGGQSCCFVLHVEEIEIPAERLAILE